MDRDIRLLLSDVDGTLVTHGKVLTPRAVAAAKALREAGIDLALTSARPPRGMRMLVEPMEMSLPLAGFNGGAWAKPDLTILETHAVTPDAAREAVDHMLALGLDVWVYTAQAWFVRDRSAPHLARESWIIQTEPTVIETFPADALDHAIKIVGVSDDHARAAEAERQVQAQFGDRVSAVRSSDFYLDITHPQATKGFVVEWLARKLELSPHQIATIGDMPNDMLMFARGGYAIAMGNASEAVKAKAQAVTDSNENDGWAKAVEKLILREEIGV